MARDLIPTFAAAALGLVVTSVAGVYSTEILTWLPYVGLAIAVPALIWLFRSPLKRRLSKQGWNTARIAMITVTVASMVGSIIWWAAGEDERIVAEYARGTCSDPMWVPSSVTCYENSEAFMADRFDAFTPDAWHHWDELGPGTQVGLTEMIALGATVSGEGISSFGRVAIPQVLNGTLVIQLKPPTPEQADQIRGSQLHDPSRASPSVLMGIPPADDPPVAVYCNFRPRPLYVPQPDELVAFNGTLIALGQIKEVDSKGRASGSTMQIAYVACSAVERI